VDGEKVGRVVELLDERQFFLKRRVTLSGTPVSGNSDKGHGAKPALPANPALFVPGGTGFVG
jgi:hypothetical protein